MTNKIYECVVIVATILCITALINHYRPKPFCQHQLNAILNNPILYQSDLIEIKAGHYSITGTLPIDIKALIEKKQRVEIDKRHQQVFGRC
ncbi:MAG: hypothetical protein CMF46_04525 [Legionellales bacterium]|nr:hypothetical protein [Legionellales bacterium]|tara:strand:- start:461 stop:733 length:273 start_codon:yes stop_codon:yes gene_type:complete